MNNKEILESIIGFDALYESMLKCKCGVIWKTSVASFCLNGIQRVKKLEDELKNGTYVPDPPRQFTITYPKKREAVSISFRDRVFQRSLNDNQIYPQMSKSLIYDNCACQKGKGTDFARNRLKTHLHKFYRHSCLNGFALKCDIKQYYPSMSHEYISSIFKKYLDPITFELANKVLTEQYQGDTGYNPGSQMIQIAGICALNELDHYIKEQLHIKYYIRYMDDFILIHEDLEYLEYCRKQIEIELDKIGFQLHEKKTKIEPINKPIDFLGFHFRLTETGKVLMNIRPEVVKRERRRLVRMVHRAKRGEMTREKVDECYSSWRNHVSKGNNFKVVQRMDKFYKDLWRTDI